MQKWLMSVVIVVVLVLGGGVAYYFYTQANQKADTTTHTADNHAEDSSSASQTSSVEIKDFAYSPRTISVKKGTTVTWTNQDNAGHSVTSDDNDKNTDKLESKLLQKGESFKATFNTPGTYYYHCTAHPNMTGTVIVTE